MNYSIVSNLISFVRNNPIWSGLLCTSATIVVILLFPDIVSAAGNPNDVINADRTAAELQLTGTQKAAYIFFTWIGGWILWFGGLLLDSTIAYLVVEMGKTLNDLGMTQAISELWKVVRDVFNLLFIFALIYVGFKIILGIGESQAKRTLGTIIIAALLINFSLYISQVIVDFTNLASHEIYQLMTVTELPADNRTGVVVKGISGSFVEKTNLASFSDRSTADLQRISDSDYGFIKIVGFALVVMLFMIITGSVFIGGAILLLSRFIILILLMIFSPLMFLGLVLPNFARHADRWWRTFLNNAFVAPAYLFMIYLALVVLDQLTLESSSFASAASAEAGETGLFGFFLYFLIVVGFAQAALVVAKEMGAAGSTQALAAANYARDKTIGAITYAPRAGTRAAVGYGSKRFEEGFDAWQARVEAGEAGAFGRSTNWALKASGLDRSIRNVTAAGKKAKFGTPYSTQDNIDYAKDRTKRLGDNFASQERTKHIKAGQATFVDIGNKREADPNYKMSEGEKEIVKNFEQAVKNMSEKQLTEGIDFKELAKEDLAVHLSDKQMDQLEKSNKFSHAQLSKIKQSRSTGFKNIANAGKDADGVPLSVSNAFNEHRNPEWLARKGVEAVGKMPIEIFKSADMIPHLTPAMLDAKLKAGDWGKEDINDIQTELKKYISDPETSSNKREMWQKWHRKGGTNGALLDLDLGPEFDNSA